MGKNKGKERKHIAKDKGCIFESINIKISLPIQYTEVDFNAEYNCDSFDILDDDLVKAIKQTAAEEASSQLGLQGDSQAYERRCLDPLDPNSNSEENLVARDLVKKQAVFQIMPTPYHGLRALVDATKGDKETSSDKKLKAKVKELEVEVKELKEWKANMQEWQANMIPTIVEMNKIHLKNLLKSARGLVLANLGMNKLPDGMSWADFVNGLTPKSWNVIGLSHPNDKHILGLPSQNVNQPAHSSTDTQMASAILMLKRHDNFLGWESVFKLVSLGRTGVHEAIKMQDDL